MVLLLLSIQFELVYRTLMLFLLGLDYNLLEDVKRVAESAQRMRVKLCGYHPQFRLPFHLKALRGAAWKSGTKLLFHSAGMTKREKNQTRYNQR